MKKKGKKEKKLCKCGKVATQYNFQIPHWTTENFCNAYYIEYLKEHGNYKEGIIEAYKRVIDRLLERLW